MSKVTKTFVSNTKAVNKSTAVTNKSTTIKFVAKVANASVNRRVTLSSNFSIAKIKK